MNANAGAKAYAKVNVESGALGADPHKLIEMLYQGALLSIANAKNGLMRKDIAAKGAAISKAITIIDEGLLSSLDKNVGGELANNLASLYEYMSRRLLVANMNNDMEAMDEVARLLTDLKGAWEAIRPVPAATPAAAKTSVVQPVAPQPIMAKPTAAKSVAPTSVAPVSVAAMPERSMPVPPATPHQRTTNKVQLAYGKV